MSTETNSSNLLTRWILPVAGFVVIVMAITWVVLNSTRRTEESVKKPTPSPTAEFSNRPAALKFLRTKAIWDLSRPDYAQEFEMLKEGFYDFPLVNPSDVPVVLGFAKTSCDCSQLKAAVLSAEKRPQMEELADLKKHLLFPTGDVEWTILPQSSPENAQEKDVLEVPPGGAGVARVYWNGRKTPGQTLNLNIRMWMHPKGKSEDRSFENLTVPILMAAPLQFTAQKLSVGSVGSGASVAGHLHAWSPTSDTVELKLDPNRKDPLLDVAISRLDAAAAEKLEKELRDEKHNTRVVSAYRIDVTVHEQKDGQQLEQGPFTRVLPILLPDNETATLPTVTGIVRGEIEVGALEDGGKINLKTFSSKAGIRRITPVWSQGDLKVEQVTPSTFKVNLKKIEKESTAARTRWSLELEVPPGAWRGGGPPDATIVLQTTATPTRRIRIPILGNAGQ